MTIFSLDPHRQGIIDRAKAFAVWDATALHELIAVRADLGFTETDVALAMGATEDDVRAVEADPAAFGVAVLQRYALAVTVLSTLLYGGGPAAEPAPAGKPLPEAVLAVEESVEEGVEDAELAYAAA